MAASAGGGAAHRHGQFGRRIRVLDGGAEPFEQALPGEAAELLAVTS